MSGADRDDARRDDARRDDPREDGVRKEGGYREDRRGRPRVADERRDERGRQRGAARAQGRVQRSAQAPSQRARGADPARAVAFDVLRAVDEGDSYANLVLPPLLRERGIRGRDAGFATELAYGTLRLRGRYDAVVEQAAGRDVGKIDPPVLDLLRLGTHQLLGMRVPAHAAVSQTVGLARERVGTGASQFVNAVLRAVARDELATWLERVGDAADPSGEDPVVRLAATQSHPQWVVRALREALVGDGRAAADVEALLDADNAAPLVALVARPGLVDPVDLLAAAGDEARPGAVSPVAVVPGGGDPAAFEAVRTGRAGVQDEGSQLVALALAAAPLEGPDERWLDLCAGPGGKAALLAALAAQRGARLVANEVQPHRARLVEQALRAVPADAVEDVRTGDGRTVGDDEPAAYDRVMVDAPCTGLGALRRRPESRWRRTPADLVGLAALQRELLGSALRAVRPGGVVAYVTCSPHLAETRLVVGDAIKVAAKAGLAVEQVDARTVARGVAAGPLDLVGDRVDLQLWPHVHGTDAMHLTLLRRLG
ncbi:RsmB/NOP family class I SAM-dependent RNA methyltransferase [Cellulomonas fulva]|uniref:RsmB/NOP family class I SAM-dependent RNA methyltransferase n=1 Tax=Cellulomonas fulva TaxID=2835530 RepID=UPI0035572E30